LEWLGWLAASILLVTMFAQVLKNWRERKLKGVNPLLYYGQALASLLFAVYSLTISSWVFAVTNTLGLIAAIIGVYLVHQCRKPEREDAAEDRDDPRALRI
jgi:uncharacterized protein with PQ loop repeat